MSATPDLTETDLFTALRAFWLAALPPGPEVIRAQVNRVPAPLSGDYVVMNSAQRARLETTVETWDRAAPNPASIVAYNPALVTIQCDVHGPGGADFAWSFVTLWRSSFGCDFLRAWCASQTPDPKPLIQPLYVPDPKQVPFYTGSQQFEDRWLVDVLLQANVSIEFDQQFAVAASVGLINVDAAYPPGG